MLAAGALMVAAGALQYSVSAGDRGINAFLGKEKSQNPFYSQSFRSEKPTGPAWLSKLRLPSLDFVEVYGQDNALPQQQTTTLPPELQTLYKDLDDAVEQEQYDLAADIKRRIDEHARHAPTP